MASTFIPPARKSLLQTYATPLVAAIFVIVAATGVLVFFHLGQNLLMGAHIWLGMAFVAASLLHVARHWKGVVHMAKQKRTHALMILSGLALGAFMLNSAGGEGGNPMKAMVGKTAQAPLVTLAPVLGVTPEILIKRLNAGGVAVADASMPLEALASQQKKPLPQLYALILEEGTK